MGLKTPEVKDEGVWPNTFFHIMYDKMDIFVTNDFVFSVSERSIQLEEHIPVYEKTAEL